MFENFREKLHLVQQDFTSSFKTLGDKSRDARGRRPARFDQSHPLHYSAGLDILSRYEEGWVLLHRRTKGCAEAAQAADGDVVLLSAQVERRRSALAGLQEQLRSLPTFVAELGAITASIAHLEGDFEELESRLVHLEALCYQSDEVASKQHHTSTLDAYQKKKRREVEWLEAELKAGYAQKAAELERAAHKRLREQQQVYEEAFRQDVKHYLSTGHLQHREPAESNAELLDQMVTDGCDLEALDHFLSSADAEASVKPAPGVDSVLWESSGSSGAFLHTDQGEAGEEGTSEESDQPLVQSDEEDVQPDWSLIGRQGGVA